MCRTASSAARTLVSASTSSPSLTATVTVTGRAGGRESRRSIVTLPAGRSGVQASSATCSAGTRSSQTGCQIPVVRWYQITCGSGCQSCLPRGWVTSVGRSSRPDDEHLLATVSHRVGDVQGERRVPTLVPPDEGSAHPHVGPVVDRAEVQEHPLTATGRNRDGAPVPDDGVVPRIVHSRRGALRWERHRDLPVEDLTVERGLSGVPAVGQPAVVVVVGEAPGAREVLPPGPDELRPGMGGGVVHGSFIPFSPTRTYRSRSAGGRRRRRHHRAGCGPARSRRAARRARDQPGVALSLAQVASDLALLLVAGLGCGAAGLRAVRRRWRVWARGVPPRTGLRIWASAILVFTAMNVASGVLHRLRVRDAGFTWSPPSMPPALPLSPRRSASSPHGW